MKKKSSKTIMKEFHPALKVASIERCPYEDSDRADEWKKGFVDVSTYATYSNRSSEYVEGFQSGKLFMEEYFESHRN